MSIPDHQTIMPSLLNLASDGQEYSYPVKGTDPFNPSKYLNMKDYKECEIYKYMSQNICGASVRLRNSILSAFKNGVMPFCTFEQYWEFNREESRYKLMKIPNLGRKSAIEFQLLVDENHDIISNFRQSINDVKDNDGSSGIYKYKIKDILVFGNDHIPSNLITRINNINDEIFNNTSLFEYYQIDNPILFLKKFKNMGNESAYSIYRFLNYVRENQGEIISKLEESNKLSEEFDDVAYSDEELISRLLNEFQKLLTSKEYEVLIYRALEGLTLEEIGVKYDVTRERIRQIESKAIRKICASNVSAVDILVSMIDEALDENYGWLKIENLSYMLDIDSDVMSLLIYILKDKLSTKVKVQDGNLIHILSDEDLREWAKEVRQKLYSMSWPISMNELYDSFDDVPKLYIDNLLYSKHKAVVKDGIIRDIQIPSTARITFSLRDIGKPSKPSEIAGKCNNLFGCTITEHNVGSTLGRMDNALIIERGVYALYEMLDYDDLELEDIRERVYEYVYNEGKYISIKVLYEELYANTKRFENLNDYTLLGIVQDDERFVTAPGLMVGLCNFSHDTHLTPLKDTIHDFVENHGPVSVSEIMEHMSDTRKVLDVTVRIFLESYDDIVQIDRSRYDSIERYFNGIDIYQKVNLAVMIVVISGVSNVFDIYKNLNSIALFKGVGISQVLVKSIVKNNTRLEYKSGFVNLISPDNDLVNYNIYFSECSIINKTPIEIVECFQSNGEFEYFSDYLEVDYRMLVQAKSQEINKILSSFGF